MKEMIQNAVDAIRAVAGARPSVGLILGSGLGGLADVLEDASFVEYASIPGFPVSTAPGHAGRFVLGRLAGHGVVCMQGRFHFYEGHPMSHIAAPVRVMKALGVETLLVTNACGGAGLPSMVPAIQVAEIRNIDAVAQARGLAVLGVRLHGTHQRMFQNILYQSQVFRISGYRDGAHGFLAAVDHF